MWGAWVFLMEEAEYFYPPWEGMGVGDGYVDDGH